MLTITVTDRDGDTTIADADIGNSLMHIIRNAGLDELLAICGGNCSCATCHVYIDPEQSDLLPAMTADEKDLLESSDHFNATSRLGCQVKFTEALAGLRVTIAPED
jgi:2Fe-2S ferredoxin